MQHKVQTTHIQAMLRDALRLAIEAENLVAGSHEQRVALKGAATQAIHAYAELQDERLRLTEPNLLRTS